jgi:hypothetical protein
VFFNLNSNALVQGGEKGSLAGDRKDRKISHFPIFGNTLRYECKTWTGKVGFLFGSIFVFIKQNANRPTSVRIGELFAAPRIGMAFPAGRDII